MSYVAPTATGSLETTPFGHLLVYALDHLLTGTLVLEQQDGSKHAVLFSEGGPAKVKTAEAVVYLGQVLIERGALTPEACERTLLVARGERRLHGEVLETEGIIDAHTLRDALREQLMRQILWMFKLPPATAYGYYDRVDFLERWGAEGVRVKPLDLIWRGVREFTPQAEIDSWLARLGGQPIRLHIDAPIQRFHFGPRQQAIIDVLRAKPQPLAELLERGLGSAEDVKRVVYVLAITRQLETGVPGVEPVGVDEAPSSSRMPVASRIPEAPLLPRTSALDGSVAAAATPDAAAAVASAAESEQLKRLRAELSRLAAAEDASHYEVLGVPAKASLEAIQGAFFALAKKFHPDRLAPEFEVLRDLATRVFARMTEANQVLGDVARRKEYDEQLKELPNAEEIEHVQRVLRATTAYQKAEVLLKRNNLAAAEAEARLALESDATQADHVALVAWIQSLKPNAKLEESLPPLDKAVHMEQNNLRVRWYRGQLLKRMGKDKRAIQDFRFIVEKDPRHLDAQREIRLFEMRRSNPVPQGKRPSDPTPKPSDGGGIFGKFFKKS